MKRWIVAIPALLECLAVSGALADALVTDAITCHPSIAQTIIDHRADNLLAVKATRQAFCLKWSAFSTMRTKPQWIATPMWSRGMAALRSVAIG